MALESIPFAPSSNIHSIWHDPDTQTLLIRYHHQSRVYRYSGISGEAAAGFSQSLSANDYLQQYIIVASVGTFIGSLPPSDDDAQGLANLLS